MKGISEIRQRLQNTNAQRDDRRAWWQVASTIFLHLASVMTLFLSAASSDWVGTSFSCVLLGLLVVRVFVLYHDCIHFSLFESKKNQFLCRKSVVDFVHHPAR